MWRLSPDSFFVGLAIISHIEALLKRKPVTRACHSRVAEATNRLLPTVSRGVSSLIWLLARLASVTTAPSMYKPSHQPNAMHPHNK